MFLYNVLAGAHGANLGYGLYGTAEEDANSNRKLHNIKSHQQISNAGQLDNTRPIEEMPYQVFKLLTVVIVKHVHVINSQEIYLLLY